MTEYGDWRLRLRLLSPLGSAMQSDTLFGHLAWQVRFAEGDEGVSRFLKPFLAGDPPFVLSDAFPRDLLPRPLGSAGLAAAATRDDYAARKRRSKAAFVSAAGFRALAQGGEPAAEPLPDPWKRVKTPHASINRITGATGDGGQFFETEAQTLECGEVDIYVRAQGAWADRVVALFRTMSRSGFGRDKSVGCGAFEVGDMAPWDGFAAPQGADGFVTLSTYMPSAADPVDGRWRLRVKRGYLGEQAGGGNPFKRPLVQIAPGAIWRGQPRPWVGRMVRDVAPGMPQAVQCGLALAVAVKWRE